MKEQLNAIRQQADKQGHLTDNGNKTSSSSSINQQSDMENCALLGLQLPQPTEYEYLRNILFEFMIGREPVVSGNYFVLEPICLNVNFSDFGQSNCCCDEIQ